MKSIKKVLITCLLLCVMAVSVTGCFKKEVVVATINGEAISKQLYYINLWSTQRQFETIQENFWNLDNIAGKSPEEFVKSKTLETITQCIVVEQKAKELNIKLKKEEKAEIKERAKTEIKNHEAFAKEYGIKQKEYEKYFTFVKQYEKVLELLAKNYEPNDNEVKAQIEVMQEEADALNKATITHVFISTKNELGEEIPEDKKKMAYERAQEVLKKAMAGADMSTLAIDYSEDELVNENLGSITVNGANIGNEEALKEAIFEQAQVGAVYPKIIETSMGYEVIKVEDVSLASNEEIRNNAILAVKNAYAKKEIEEMTSFADVQKSDVYEQIKVGPNGITNEAQ